jgi:hypothetical protein
LFEEVEKVVVEIMNIPPIAFKAAKNVFNNFMIYGRRRVYI